MENSNDMKEHEQQKPVTDRRIRKTRAALKHSLTVLMKEKSVKDISVKELTSLADVNRGTFYLHYKDVFDLLEQSEDDLLQELHETVNAFPPTLLNEKPNRLFEEIYALCLENADLVRILIGENGDIKFLNKLKKLMHDRLDEWSNMLRTQHPQAQNFDSYFAFLVGGCISLLQYWFQNGMHETPTQLADITCLFLERGV